MFRHTAVAGGARRSFTTACPARHQHLMFWGDVLGYSAPSRFAKVSRGWLDEVGVGPDVDHGLRLSGLSGGPHHFLLSYTLLDQPLEGAKSPRVFTEEVAPTHTPPESQQGEAQEADESEGVVLIDGMETERGQVSKVFSLGRNTHAQLGLGFSSQEATRGMVTGEIEGRGGVQSVVAGNGFSFLVTFPGNSAEGAKGDAVYGFGNDTLGQLGASLADAALSTSADPYDISTRLDGGSSNTAPLRLLPLPKKLTIGTDDEWKVRDLAAGLDHSILLLERDLAGYKIQQVLSTGLNTDGQLGLTRHAKADEVPIDPLLSRHFQPVPIELVPTTATATATAAEGEITAVVCGADTSYALTQGGNVWVWGNSEYGQSLASVHDRIAAPILVPNPLPEAYHAANLDHISPPMIQKLVAGGSFAAILDSHGKVWVAGYGPTSSASKRSNEALALVEGFGDTVVEGLYCGWEYLVAITRGKEDELGVWVWGVPPRSVSSVPIEMPTQVPYTIPKTSKQQWLDENPRLKKQENEKASADEREARITVEHVACTRDHLLIVFNDGKGKDVWAECVQPPKSKGTDIV